MTQQRNEACQPLYDTALKSLMEDHAAEIIPELLPGAVLLNEANVKLASSTIRADLVYFIKLDGEPCVLDLELQTGVDSDMPFRMLLYHVGLYNKYHMPVISMAMYPFETAIPEPIFREQFKRKTSLEFEHTILRL